MAVTATVRNLSNWTPISQNIASPSTDNHFDFASRVAGIWPLASVPANAKMLVRFDFISTPEPSLYNSAGSFFVQYTFASSSLSHSETLPGTIGKISSTYTVTFSASGNDMRMTVDVGAGGGDGDLTVIPTIVLAQIS